MEPVQRTPVSERSNLAHWFTGRVHEVLDEVMNLEPESPSPPAVRVAELSPVETAEAIVEIAAAKARLDGLEAALLAHADTVDVAADSGATSTAAWLAHQTQRPRGEANRALRLAKRLSGGGFDATTTALLTGTVDRHRAVVVVDAVDALPVYVGVEERAHAESHLLKEAARHNAKELGVLAKHLHHVIDPDPDAADAELAKRLDAEERDAARRTVLRLYDDGAGTCHGSFRIPTADGAKLAKALDGFASPKRPDAIRRETVDHDGTARPVSAPELLGQAFRQWIDRFPADGLPTAGGSNATVVVTMSLDTLLGSLKAAALDTGGQLSAPEARVMACQAGVIPAVLDSTSQLLDLGRRVRLHTKAQRIAIAHRDQHCTATGCTVPAAWCHVHHKTPWSRGGRTTVNDGTLLCPRHHTMVHRPDYTATYRPDGKTRIARTSRRRP
jgi:hypothetical protein